VLGVRGGIDTLDGLNTLEDACGDDPSWVCRRVFEDTDNATLAAIAEWFVAKPLTILLIVLLAFIVSRIARWAIKRVMRRLGDPEKSETRQRIRDKTPNVLLTTGDWNLRAEARIQTLIVVFRSIASLIVWFIAVVWILEVLGVALGPLIAGAGIAGVALGFGAQNVVRDFLAGFFLIVEDQFGVGDIVDLSPDVAGTVEKITLRSTRVRDVNGTVWHMPNGQIMRAGNKSQEWARALIDLEVSRDSDLELVQQVIGETAAEIARDPAWSHEILESPEVWGVEALTPGAVTIRLVVKTRPASQFGVMRELRLRLKRALDDAGIDMPPPPVLPPPAPAA
jgi:small conductance mechanosensitive channel